MNTFGQGYVVAAYFERQSDAENAVRELQAAGFRSNQIGSSFEDSVPEEYDQLGYVGTVQDRQVASDEYSANSATSSASAHHESFWDKVKDFFSGETADSDINDNAITTEAHGSVTNRAGQTSWQSSGIHVPNSYDERLKKGGGLITVHAQDRAEEAEQILTRSNGQIDRSIQDDFGKYQLGSDERTQAGTPGTPYDNSAAVSAAEPDQGLRADVAGGTPQQNPEVTARRERESTYRSETPRSIGGGANAASRRDREADPAYRSRAEIGQDQESLPSDSSPHRIRMISDALRERSRQAVSDAKARRSAQEMKQDLGDDVDPSQKVA